MKPRHTLDLVVLAAEWGHGRRQGRLSNLHLGARDPETGGFVMLGKTFKGLTDEMLRLADRAAPRTGRHTTTAGRCTSAPNWSSRSPSTASSAAPATPAAIALRFARVLRHRPDKPPTEADTIETVRAVSPR